MKPSGPLRVAALIDHRPNHPGEMGGLAGTWEQITQVVSGRTDLDLTVFFLGDVSAVISRGPNVRHVLLPSALGTERIPFLRGVPTHTDLAPFHPVLFRRLHGFDLLHTTDAFHAFARTALWRSGLSRIPLVNSVQTDIIGWARIYTPRFVNRLLPGPMARWILESYGYLDRQERSMERRFGGYLRRCAAAFISHDRDRERIRRLAPSTPTFFLRRGIDLDRFHPSRRDRKRLERRWGIPETRPLLLFVGRIDPVKGALVAAQVARGLLESGRDPHLLMVGDGSQRREVEDLLGARVTLTGNLPHTDLGWMYASADLLLFPSEAEVWPNVVMEARASGLPVMACREGAHHVMRGNRVDGILMEDREPSRWVAEADDLLARPEELLHMGARARQRAEETAPSWRTVLEEDVLPVWSGVVGGSLSTPLS
jgi:glycosyltransferase involved in cell wall biosynthesis